MSDHHDDDPPPGPFPAAQETSPFPPLMDVIPDASVAAPPADPPSDWNNQADAHDLPTAGPLAALGRFAFPPAPPLDEDGAAARERRWTGRVIACVTVFLLVFNIASVQDWARRQEPGWVTETVERLADVWAEQMGKLGAEQPRLMIRDAYGRLRDLRFDPSPHEATQAPAER